MSAAAQVDMLATGSLPQSGPRQLELLPDKLELLPDKLERDTAAASAEHWAIPAFSSGCTPCPLATVC